MAGKQHKYDGDRYIAVFQDTCMEFTFFLKFLLVASLGFSACSTLLVFAAVVEPCTAEGLGG